MDKEEDPIFNRTHCHLSSYSFYVSWQRAMGLYYERIQLPPFFLQRKGFDRVQGNIILYQPHGAANNGKTGP